MHLDREQGLTQAGGEQLALECPHCSVYARMVPVSLPDIDMLAATRPTQTGVVCHCDSCKAPVFLRFGIKEISDDRVELNRNFFELERPREQFAFSYLPKPADSLFREALACYSGNHFNAFASMCRRAADTAFESLGESGKLRAYEEMHTAQDIAGIDEDTFAPVKQVIFGRGGELPFLDHAQAGILLEVLKDVFYQCFVRHGKLTRALKLRRFFVEDGGAEAKNSA